MVLKIQKVMLAIGFRQSQGDNTLFFKHFDSRGVIA